MHPRYKVIADYPGNIILVGSVHTVSRETEVAFCDEYQHLFRRLEWWEERQPEEMPEYVKIIRDELHPNEVPYYGKVDKWTGLNFLAFGFRLSNGSDGIYTHAANTEPATREEYEAFTQTQQP